MDKLSFFSNLESEVVVAQYMAAYLFLLLIVQIRTGAYKTHRIPILITLIFVINSQLKIFVPNEFFLLWHSVFVIGIAVVSWILYYKAKKITKVCINIIPMMILMMFIFLHTIRPYFEHSDFMIIHGGLASIVVTVLTILPIMINIAKKNGKTSVLERYVY